MRGRGEGRRLKMASALQRRTRSTGWTALPYGRRVFLTAVGAPVVYIDQAGLDDFEPVEERADFLPAAEPAEVPLVVSRAKSVIRRRTSESSDTIWETAR
jgi:hypothetical protein